MHAITYLLVPALALAGAASSTPTRTSALSVFARQNVCVEQCADYVMRESGQVGCVTASSSCMCSPYTQIRFVDCVNNACKAEVAAEAIRHHAEACDIETVGVLADIRRALVDATEALVKLPNFVLY